MGPFKEVPKRNPCPAFQEGPGQKRPTASSSQRFEEFRTSLGV